MDLIRDAGMTRRGVLAGGGALIVSFAILPHARAQGRGQDKGEGQTAQPEQAPELPGALEDTPWLDSWIRIDADGRITVFTGKAELGQGIRTAVIQVAAEELRVAPDAIELVTADTSRTPNERYTAGSQSMSDSATAVRNAAAQVREILIGIAAKRFKVQESALRTENGAITGEGHKAGYGDLVSDRLLHVRAKPESKLTPPEELKIIGKSLPRLDIPGKVTGAPSYVHDLRLPGMVHARVVRPPSYGARLSRLDSSEVEQMPGVIRVVRDGSFLAVVAEGEYQAVQAMTTLGRAARWNESETLPAPDEIFSVLQRLSSNDSVIHEAGMPGTGGGKRIEASFRRNYQMHSAIGPSCAVAQFVDGNVTVWTHSQGVYPLRDAIAEMLRMPPDSVQCIHVEGAGCYGHNGADDVGADAALIARALPGRPVRVQWMREQEHTWEPYGAAMTTRGRAAVGDDGRIVDWEYEVWSNTHSTRPGGAGRLVPAWHIAESFEPPPPRELKQPSGGGDRNAIPLYRIPNARVVKHFIPEMPLRVSALRGLGAYMNVFSIESMMDELANAAKIDPVEFRLRHLEDERAREVIRAAADRFGWDTGKNLAPGHGRGFGFARYKNFAGYAAVAIEVAVDRDRGRVQPIRVAAAAESGEAVNPDGIRNQIEGGIIQSISWTLYESVSFDRTRITSRDWGGYPILRFPAVPERLDVDVINRPGTPFLGTGEAAQGPTAAAVANAIANATGHRFRELPITPSRIKAVAAL